MDLILYILVCLFLFTSLGALAIMFWYGWADDRVKYLKEIFICRRKGHDWEMYIADSGVNSYESYYDNIEQAGYCKRCGYDTHGQYPHPLNFIGRFVDKRLRKLVRHFSDRKNFDKADLFRKLMVKVWKKRVFQR